MNHTIEQRMSGTGNIYSLASDLFTRQIKGRGEYAVVLSAYYGGRGYTTHLTADAAIAQYNRTCRQGFSCELIGADGQIYDVAITAAGETLVPRQGYFA